MTHFFALSGSATHPAPEWAFVSNAHRRLVVLTDPAVDGADWSIEFRTVDGAVGTAAFACDTVWCDDDGVVNVAEAGRPVAVWAARIEAGARLEAMTARDGSRIAVDPWLGMSSWLVESLYAQPPGLIVDLGPGDYVAPDDDASEDEIVDDVVNAQIHVLTDGVLLLRRSHTVLGWLRLGDSSVAESSLDEWFHDDHFEDCTDGYLFTRDRTLVADACTAWFRDTAGWDSPDRLGCSYDFPDELPRSDT